MAKRQARSRTTAKRRTAAPGNGVTQLLRDGMLTLRETAAQRGAYVGDLLRAQGGRYLKDRKSAAADELASLGDAIRLAANKLHGRDIHRLAEYAGSAAERVDQVARFVEQHDVDELARELAAFARRRPAMIVGGLFLAGLAAGRFLNAGTAQQRSRSARRH